MNKTSKKIKRISQSKEIFKYIHKHRKMFMTEYLKQKTPFQKYLKQFFLILNST